MQQIIESLLVLQQRDERVAHLQQEIARVPRDLLAIDQAWQAINATVDGLKAALRQAELDRKKLGLDAQTVRDQILRYRTQQQQTKKNEEFQALIHEIEHGEKKITEIEDRELALMEQVAELEKKVAAEQVVLKQKDGEFQTQRTDLQRKDSGLKEQLVAAQAEQKTAEEKVEEAELKRYRRILVSKKTKAVVAVAHGMCGGCHMKITAQTSLRAKGGLEIVTCDNCGRILYWDELQ